MAVTVRSSVMKCALLILALLTTAILLYLGNWLLFDLLFNLLVFVFLAAVVATVLSHDRRFWTGFAIVGGGYFLVSLILSAGSRLFTTYVLAMISSNPSGSGELEGWTSYPLLTNMEDLPESFSPFVAIGHCLFSIWFAVGAGILSTAVFNPTDARAENK